MHACDLVFVSLAFAVVGGVLVWALAAPDIDSERDALGFGQFFGTSAQVMAALLIALAIEVSALPVTRVFKRGIVLAATVLHVGVGEVAAITALSPRLPHDLYGPLLGITTGTGLETHEAVRELVKSLGGGDIGPRSAG